MLLHPEASVDQITEIFLFAADRAEHVSKIITPALKEKKVVISDRFIDSTVAYQCGGRGLPEDLVRYVNMVSAQGLIPDITFLLDVSPETGIRRVTQLGPQDRFEKERIEFHRKVRRKYLQIARENPARIKVLNTESKEIEELQHNIRKVVEGHLK